MEAARRHKGLLMLALLAGTAAAALLSLCVGSVSLSLGEVAAALLGRGQGVSGSIVLYARLPRMLAALVCGCALAVGGVIIQGVLGNPLAGPNIIGGQRRGGAGSHFVLRPAARLHDGGACGGLRGGAVRLCAGVHPGPPDGGQPDHPGAGRCGHQQHPVRRH